MTPVKHRDVIVKGTSNIEAIDIKASLGSAGNHIECEHANVELMLRAIEMARRISTFLNQVREIRDSLVYLDVVNDRDSIPIDSGFLKEIVQTNQ
ncbi:TPA: hypothetical protein QDB31_003273 [Burkholderia vietnamiensis]|nr:hypothetical protein [Burkholderia vietnamiensis]